MSGTQLLRGQPRPEQLRENQRTEQNQRHVGMQDQRGSPGYHIRPRISSPRILEIVLRTVPSASLLAAKWYIISGSHFERIIYKRECKYHRLKEHKHCNEPERSQLALRSQLPGIKRS